MKKYFIKTVGAVLMLLSMSSCLADKIPHSPSGQNPVNVGIYVGGSHEAAHDEGHPDTRTVMGDNGLSAHWTDEDRLSVWARTSSGSFLLSNQIFTAYGLDDRHGYFTSTLASAMPEDTYTYYCCYPTPISVSGTNVTFSLPAHQDGKASAGADIMIADPVQHGPLTAVPEIEDHSGMSLQMNRMMHQFRFQVPSSDIQLKGVAIEKMRLTFPVNVVGNVQLDLSDPKKQAALSNGGKEIILSLKEPVDAQKQNYACVAFVPTQFTQGQSLQIKAYTADKIVNIEPINLRSKNCQAGHSTPVMLIIKSVTDYPYQLTFKVSANNLGENPNFIKLEAPSGCRWPDSGTNVFTYDPGRQITVGEEIVFRFEDEAQYRAFSGKNITVTYDSDHAITRQSVTVGNLSSADKASVALTVPYLFAEDFSGISSFNDGHDNPTVGISSDTYKGITELSSKTSALSGWYGTRIGGQSGTSIRICCRYEHVLLAGAYYKGRVYTPFLSNIKDGKDVKITVSFRYGSNRNERDPLLGSRPDKSPVMYFGINTQEQVINPDQNEGNIIDQVTGLIGGSGYASSAVTSLSPIAIKGETLPKTGGSYTSFAGTKSVTVENVDNGMRLAWVLSTDNTASNTNANYWLYLDDIKVSITQ